MQLHLNKKGQISGLSGGQIGGVISTFIGVVILITVVAELIPEVQTAGDALNATGAPLAGLFASDGIVVLIIMAAILLVIVGVFLAVRSGRRRN